MLGFLKLEGLTTEPTPQRNPPKPVPGLPLQSMARVTGSMSDVQHDRRLIIYTNKMISDTFALRDTCLLKDITN